MEPATVPGSGTGKLIAGRYEIIRLLGRGATAKVYLAADLHTGGSVAVKSISKHSCASPSSIVREVAIMRRLRHPHIVRLLEVVASRSRIHFVLELAAGGELFHRLESRGRFPEDLARRYFQQLISAVGFCHARGVFHRDLKLENLLLDEKGDLKVTDFGLSAQVDQIRNDGLFHTLCGTPAYVAPDILSKKGYDADKVDIWSCGVILFLLIAGYLPFNDPNLMAMYKKIYRGEFRCPSWTSPELRNLIERILDPNPKTRISLAGIINHPWFKKGLDEEKWTAKMRFRDEELVKEEAGRVLNAFDIISFSSGCDLSGLFDVAPDRERFVSGERAESVVNRVEEVGRIEGLRIRRGKKKALLEGQNGNLVARVEVHRLTDDLSVVEVVKGEGPKERRLWRERIGPALKVPAI
ncbi:CBL-interacting protein kinase 29-like [Typha latifolia]|uniref:CBL-interacting protein kinase 29-like n=1 Tax=Typha latifolia TaxID=4733 RepID=UPI003C2EC337